MAFVNNRGRANFSGGSANAGPVLENPGVQNCSVGQYVALDLKAWDNAAPS